MTFASIPVAQLEPPEPQPEEVDRLVENILAADEFQPPDRPWLRRQWDRFIDWLESLLDGGDEPPPEVLDAPSGGGGPGSVVAYLLLAAVLVLAVWVALRVVRSRQGRQQREDDDGDGVSVEIEHRHRASDWRSRALELEAEGAHKPAVRAWLRWGIRSLIDLGVLDDVPGRTTGEYRRRVAADRPDLTFDFDRASRLFDEVWYADRAASADTVATVREHVERLVEAAPTSQPGPDESDRPLAEIS